MIIPAAPLAFNVASTTLEGSNTVIRSLVAQQSTSLIFFFPPSPAVIKGASSYWNRGFVSTASPLAAALAAATSALLYNFGSSLSGSLPGVFQSNFLIKV